MSTSKITSKGQITIPLDVRMRLGLDTGDRVEFIELATGEFIIKPALEDVSSIKGMFSKPKQAVTIENMRATIRRRASGQ